MNYVKTYVDRSPIEGLGMFAAEFIAKGTVIWKCHKNFDVVIPYSEFLFARESVPVSMADDLEKYGFVKHGVIIYCIDNAKYCNHSETPNTKMENLVQYAIDDIQEGQEITCSYYEFDENFKGFDK